MDKNIKARLEDLLGVEGIEIIQASSIEEGMEKIKKAMEAKCKGMSDKDKSNLAKELMDQIPTYDKYVTAGATISTILKNAHVPYEYVIGGSLAMVANFAALDYAEELHATRPCEVSMVEDENIIPFTLEIEEKIKPLISTMPKNKVITALTSIAAKVLCEEEELAKKMKSKEATVDNKTTEEGIKKAIECLRDGNLLEAQGILNTIANIKK